MILSAICNRGCRVFVDVAVLLLLLVLIPGIPPHVTYSSYEIDEERPLEGPLAPNNILDSARRILDGKIVGPESIASKDGEEIFVSLHGGKILRIYGKRFDHFKIVTTIGPGCDGPWQEKVCGRPLGLRFAPDGRLLVIDSYLGLFSVDIETGEKELIFDPTEKIDGVVPLLMDDIDIDNDGNIYWSDASTVSDLSDGVIEMLCDPSGRILKYDPTTKKNTVLVKNIHFANGVQLSPGQDFLLFSETFRKRILRYWLAGPKAGTSDIFVDRLPGMPDNLRSKSDGGYYVSLVSVRKPNTFDTQQFLSKLPWLRKLMLRLVNLMKLMFEGINNLYQNKACQVISHKIFNLEPIAQLLSGNKTIVVELDAEGNIVGSMQGNNGRLRFISETDRFGDNIFFGSPYNKYLGHLYVGVPEMEVEGQGVKMKVEIKEPEKEEKTEELKSEKEKKEAGKAETEKVKEEEVEKEKAKEVKEEKLEEPKEAKKAVKKEEL